MLAQLIVHGRTHLVTHKGDEIIFLCVLHFPWLISLEIFDASPALLAHSTSGRSHPVRFGYKKPTELLELVG